MNKILKYILCFLCFVSTSSCFSIEKKDTIIARYESDWVIYNDLIYKIRHPSFNCQKYGSSWAAINCHVYCSKFEDIPKRKERKCDEILPHLYVGGEEAIKYCIEHKLVDRIVSFHTSKHRVVPKKFKGLVQNFRVGDNKHTNICDVYKKSYHFMQGTKKGLLIHCKKGHSRSVSLCILYIMKRYDLSYEIASHYVKTMRPTASPNRYFIKQMRESEMKR